MKPLILFLIMVTFVSCNNKRDDINNQLDKIYSGVGLEEIETHFEVLRMDSFNAESNYLIAKHFESKDSIEDAIQFYERIRPNQLISKEMKYMSLGRAQLNLGNTGNALNSFLVVSSENQEYYDVNYYLGLCHDLLGLREAGELYYLKHLDIDGNHKETIFNLASLLYESGRFEKALVHTEKLLTGLSSEENYTDVVLLHAYALSYTGENEQAVAFLSEALDSLPRSPRILVARAGLYGFMNDEKKMIEDCKEALRIESNKLGALEMLINYYDLEGENDSLEKYTRIYDSIVRLNENDISQSLD